MTSTDILAILALHDLCLFRDLGAGNDGRTRISIRHCDGTAVDNRDVSTYDVPEEMSTTTWKVPLAKIPVSPEAARKVTPGVVKSESICCWLAPKSLSVASGMP